MLSRRKMFGWVAGLAGTVASVPALASTRLRQMIDAKMFADFPGDLIAARAPHLLSRTRVVEFHEWQKWFRDHPDLLWSSPYFTQAELVRQHVLRLSEAFQASNPDVEYAAWLDAVTDNLLVRVYTRRNGVAAACALAFTRRSIETGVATDDQINEAWGALTAAINGNPVNADYLLSEGTQMMIKTLSELKAA